MGDDLDFVELFLPEPTVDQPCDLPAEGGDLSSETLDSASSYVGNKTDSKMTPEGCGALVYVDETNRAVRFAIFTKGNGLPRLSSKTRTPAVTSPTYHSHSTPKADP